MYKRILFIPHWGMGKEYDMEKAKYYLFFTDDEDIAYYVEDNSIEGYLSIDDGHIHFEADDYTLDLDDANIEEDDDDNITVSTGSTYYTFSLHDIESIE